MSTTANDASLNWNYRRHQGHVEQHQQIYSTFWVWFKHLTLEIECHCWTAPVECSAPQSFNNIISPPLVTPAFGHQAPDWAAKNALKRKG